MRGKKLAVERCFFNYEICVILEVGIFPFFSPIEVKKHFHVTNFEKCWAN